MTLRNPQATETSLPTEELPHHSYPGMNTAIMLHNHVTSHAWMKNPQSSDWTLTDKIRFGT
uniref:Uncharacterized protein n=1 Tax=Arundo donax TaxID=35708 RepID=A0A0A9FK45_ARUDO